MPTFAKMGSLYLAFTSLLVFSICDCHAVGCPRIMYRSEWKARPRRSSEKFEILVPPLPYVVVHHTATPSCTTEVSCKSIVKSIQGYHMDYNGWGDIGYNFLIGGDGNVYEGRGWNIKGAHAGRSFNFRSLGISMIGNYSSSLPSPNMLNVLKKFLKCAESRGITMSGYILLGHRQVGETLCPGNALYSKLEILNRTLDSEKRTEDSGKLIAEL